MELTEEQFSRIAHVLPCQHGNVRIANLCCSMRFCTWPQWLQMALAARALRQVAYGLHAHDALEQGRRARRVFAELQHKQLLRVCIECLSLDSTIVKMHPKADNSSRH